MEDKILGLQFKSVPAKPTRPNYKFQKLWIYRSGRSQVFFKISFTRFTEKHLCWSLFLIKLQAWRPTTLLKETPTRCFPVNTAKLLTAFFIEHLWLLQITKLALNRCEENHFSVEFFSETYWKLFLVFAAAFLKTTSLQVFRSFCPSLNMSEVYLEPSQTSRWSLLRK